MISGSILDLVPILLGLFATQPGIVEQTVTRLVVQDEVIIRVRVPVRPPTVRLDWKEHKGPKCIPTSEIRGAFLSGNDHVDFLMSGHRRLRAKFDEDCPALDFYTGFYLTSDDEKICSGRDVIRSRSGGTCLIDRFRKLIPKRHD